MNLRKTSPPLFEIRSQPQGLVAGYGAVFGGIDSYGDTIAPGAFQASLSRGTPLFLWQHRMEQPVGRWTALHEDSRGLHVEGQLNLQTAAGREAFAHLQAGDLSGLSIGFNLAPGGSKYADGVNVLTQIDLAEISIVSLPADSAARVHSVKAALQKPESIREFEAALEGLGYSRREARGLAAKGWGAPPDTSEELAAALTAATKLFQKPVYR